MSPSPEIEAAKYAAQIKIKKSLANSFKPQKGELLGKGFEITAHTSKEGIIDEAGNKINKDKFVILSPSTVITADMAFANRMEKKSIISTATCNLINKKNLGIKIRIPEIYAAQMGQYGPQAVAVESYRDGLPLTPNLYMVDKKGKDPDFSLLHSMKLALLSSSERATILNLVLQFQKTVQNFNYFSVECKADNFFLKNGELINGDYSLNDKNTNDQSWGGSSDISIEDFCNFFAPNSKIKNMLIQKYKDVFNSEKKMKLNNKTGVHFLEKLTREISQNKDYLNQISSFRENFFKDQASTPFLLYALNEKLKAITGNGIAWEDIKSAEINLPKNIQDQLRSNSPKVIRTSAFFFQTDSINLESPNKQKTTDLVRMRINGHIETFLVNNEPSILAIIAVKELLKVGSEVDGQIGKIILKTDERNLSISSIMVLLKNGQTIHLPFSESLKNQDIRKFTALLWNKEDRGSSTKRI